MDNRTNRRSLAEFNEIMRESDGVYRALAANFGISESVFWIFYALLCEDHPITQSDIIEVLQLPKQTVNSALKGLSADGLLTLQSGADRRKKELTLTDAGRILAEDSAGAVLSAELSAMNELSEAEQEQFLSLFRRFVDALKEQSQALRSRQEGSRR